MQHANMYQYIRWLLQIVNAQAHYCVHNYGPLQFFFYSDVVLYIVSLNQANNVDAILDIAEM